MRRRSYLILSISCVLIFVSAVMARSSTSFAFSSFLQVALPDTILSLKQAPDVENTKFHLKQADGQGALQRRIDFLLASEQLFSSAA